MTNPGAEGVGSAATEHTAASSAPSKTAQGGSVRIAKAAVTNPHSVFLKDLTYHHLRRALWKRHFNTKTIFRSGAASAYATTRGTKRWIAPRGSCAATVEDAATCSSYAPTGVTTLATNVCTVKERRAIPNSTATERVEVEPTSIQKGG